jgi:16S rRNA (cytidine1402-2'-O)-methyltransferase
MASSIYLIPIHIHEEGFAHIISDTTRILHACDVFFCENIKTARRFVKKIDPQFTIDDKQWHTIDKHNAAETQEQFLLACKQNITIGIMSEAGCPAIADPGSELVAIAHKQHCTVLPITGPSSILLALMSSGFNGQRFLFEGYLPIQPNDRQKKLQQLELFSKKEQCTIIFIEAPYRNQALLDTITKTCEPQTQLCIASNITATNQYINTTTIANWKAIQPPVQKIDTIFLLYAG